MRALYHSHAVKASVIFLIVLSEIEGQGRKGGMGASGGSGAKDGIMITPPPEPQEILPPKPIIIAPLMVRQMRKKHKMTVYKTGPAPDPFNMPSPFTPGYPAFPSMVPNVGGRMLNRNGYMPYPASYPMPYQMSGYEEPEYPNIEINLAKKARRLNMGTQVKIDNVATKIPELSKLIENSSALETSKEDLEGKAMNEMNQFKDMDLKIEDIVKKITELGSNLDSLDNKLSIGYNTLDQKILEVEQIKNKARRNGIM